MKVFDVVLRWGPVDTSCFTHSDLCYGWSVTGDSVEIMPDGWVGQSHYYTFVEVPSVSADAAFVAVAPIPEPSVALLFGAGLLLMWLRRFGYRPEAPPVAWRQRSAR